MVEVSIVSTLDGVRSLAPHWRELERRCPERFTYFQTYDWCVTWLATFRSGARPCSPHIVTVWCDGRLAALWPGHRDIATAGTRRITTAGVPHTQYAGILHDPDLLDAAVEQALRRALHHALAADVVTLESIPQGSLLARITGAEYGSELTNETALLDLSAYASWEQYTASLPGPHRRKRKQRRNRLATLGDVGFRAVWPGDPDYRGLLATALGWKRVWLAETGRFSVGLSMDGHEAFLAALPGDAAGLSGACLFALEISGRPVAIELGFLHRGHYYSYLGCFDWAHRDLSPGKIAMEMCQRWLLEAGVRSYDLLGNPADYKATWSNTTVPLSTVTRSTSLRGRMVGEIWVKRLKPALKQAYAQLPQGLRRAMVSRNLTAVLSTTLILEAA